MHGLCTCGLLEHAFLTEVPLPQPSATVREKGNCVEGTNTFLQEGGGRGGAKLSFGVQVP